MARRHLSDVLLLSPAFVAHHLEALQLHVVVEQVDAGLSLRDVHLLLRRVHAVEVRQQQPPLPAFRHDHTVAGRVQLVDRLDGHGREQHIHRIRQRVQLVGAHGREARILRSRRHAVAHDLGGRAARHRRDGADTAAQLAVFVQRHEHAGALVRQLGRQAVGHRYGVARAHEPFDAGAGKRNVRVDRRIVRGCVARTAAILIAVNRGPHGAVAGRALHLERGHRVTHAEGAFVAEQLVRDGKAFQRARHDPERAQAAFRRLLAERLVYLQQTAQIARIEQRGDHTVEHGALRSVAVRAVARKLMGQVAAGDEDAAAIQIGGRLGDAAPQREVRLGREARQPDAHHLVRRICLVHEMQRHDGGMVEILPAHAAAAQRHRVLARARGYGGRHLAVVLHGHGRVPCAEAERVGAVAGGERLLAGVPDRRCGRLHRSVCLWSEAR